LVRRAVSGARPPKALSKDVKVSTTELTALAALFEGLGGRGGDFVAGAGGLKN
jgi:hypothetical protein